MPDLGIFGLELENNVVISEISTLEYVYLQNFTKKQKCLNLGKKFLIWIFLGQNFKNTIAIFEISTLKCVYFQNFTKKQKCINLVPKMPDLCIFGLRFESNIVIFETNTLEFVYLQHFAKKTKMLKFGIKFQNFRKLLSYLKSATSNQCNRKIF